MKQILITIFSIMCCLQIMADNTATVGQLTIKAGETQTVEVSLQNSDPIANIQFQLLMPTGLKVTDVTCDEYSGETLPNMWDAGIKANMGNPWKTYFGENNGRTHILLTSGNARYKNESDVTSDFGISLKNSKAIMKVTFTADETFKEDSHVTWAHASATNTKNTGVIVVVSDLSQTNSIENAADDHIDKKSYSDDKLYTIQGIRIKYPTQPGVYVRNGKKFVVK